LGVSYDDYAVNMTIRPTTSSDVVWYKLDEPY